MIDLDEGVSKLELFRKNLRWILEGFKLQRISTRIEEEHGGLLAYFTLKPDVGFDDKLHPMNPELIGQLMPLVPT